MVDLSFLNKKNARAVVENFENHNDTKLKNFSVKEMLLIFHKELLERYEKIDIKIDKHISWGQKEDNKLHKALSDHDILFQEIIDKLPEKGFCERVENALFPVKELPLASKVDTMWHDRRWVRYILYAIFAFGGVNILIQIMW